MVEIRKSNFKQTVVEKVKNFIFCGKWLMCDRAKIAYGLAALAHLYPKPVFPADKSQWDIGHKCLAYFDKVLPFRKLMSSSFYYLLFKQVNARGAGLTYGEWIGLYTIGPISRQRMKQFRHNVGSKNATVENLKKWGFANCAELSVVACRWLQNQGVNAHHMHCYFERGIARESGHDFVMYTLPGTPQLSVDEMMQDLKNPNIRICDLWTQKCGTVPEMFNYYVNTFIMVENGKFVPIALGLNFRLEKSCSYPLSNVGVVSKKEDGNLEIDLYPDPQIIRLQTFSERYEQEKQQIDNTFEYLKNHWGNALKVGDAKRKALAERGARED